MKNQLTGPEPPCQMTIREHKAEIVAALVSADIGGACEGTYKALVELAEEQRRVHGFAPYVAPEENLREFAPRAH